MYMYICVGICMCVCLYVKVRTTPGVISQVLLALLLRQGLSLARVP